MLKSSLGLNLLLYQNPCSHHLNLYYFIKMYNKYEIKNLLLKRHEYYACPNNNNSSNNSFI